MDFVAIFKILKHLFIENSKIGVENWVTKNWQIVVAHIRPAFTDLVTLNSAGRDLKGYTWDFETGWSNGKVSVVDICKNTDISTISHFQMVANIHQLCSPWRSELFYNWFYMYQKWHDQSMDHTDLIGAIRGDNIRICKMSLSVVLDWLWHWFILGDGPILSHYYVFVIF